MQRLLLLMLFFLLGLSSPSVAQGDLLVTPTRVVFESNKQKEALNLLNMGKDTATYTISFIQYSMKEDGSFVAIETPDSGQMFADSYLRVFPRRVTLAPGESQVIMLQCRRNATMVDGEYRSHIWFRSEKNYKARGKEPLLDSNQLSVTIIPIFGITIPVIIRSGAVHVSSTLSDLMLETQKDAIQTLKLTINRIGNISIYGDFIIEYIPTQGKSFQVAEVRGVGVYTTVNKRNMKLCSGPFAQTFRQNVP